MVNFDGLHNTAADNLYAADVGLNGAGYGLFHDVYDLGVDEERTMSSYDVTNTATFEPGLPYNPTQNQLRQYTTFAPASQFSNDHEYFQVAAQTHQPFTSNKPLQPASVVHPADTVPFLAMPPADGLTGDLRVP